MNFLSLVLVVISTAGIQNIYADWAQERECLGTQFLKLITILQEKALRSVRDTVKRQILTADPVKVYGKMNDWSTQYGYALNGQDLESFQKFTRERIEYFTIGTLTIAAKKSGAPQFRDTIEELCKNINKDTRLPDKYKYKNLPLRDFLKEIYTGDFKGTDSNFLIACPLESVTSTTPSTEPEFIKTGPSDAALSSKKRKRDQGKFSGSKSG